MCGSGTSCVMAARHLRNYLGIDISKEYCRIAERRVACEATQLEMVMPLLKANQ